MAFYPTRVRYGLRLIVRLAMQNRAQRLSIGGIAAEEGVSVKYLEQIVSLLKPLGILESIRGAHGGYVLAKDASDIYLDAVFRALGGLDVPAPCFENTVECQRMDICTTYPLWKELYTHMQSYLCSKTLADVVAGALHRDLLLPQAQTLPKDGCAPANDPACPLQDNETRMRG